MEQEAAGRSRTRVLIVDDEVTIAKTLALILQQHGFECLAAFSGEQAVAAAREFCPNCLISDVVMPGISGVEAAERILEFLPRCQVVLITGQGFLAGGFLEGARERGHDFLLLEKPVHPTELMARVDSLLARARKGRRPRVILNVDDSDIQRYAVTRMLQSAGYAVQEAASGEEAIGVAQTGPDLILLDIHLPDVDGFEVCRRLKSDRKTAAIPVVHLTNRYKDQPSQLRSAEVGAADYLMHPVLAEELVQRLEAVVKRRIAGAGAVP